MAIQDSQALKLLQDIEAVASIITSDVYPRIQRVLDTQEALQLSPAQVIPLLTGTAFEGLEANDLTAAFLALQSVAELLDEMDETYKRALIKVLP